MTEETSEAPSTRMRGEVEAQELAFAPPNYDAIDASRRGRWIMLGRDAVIWTDDEDGAGVFWLRRTEAAVKLHQHFRTARSAEVPATTAYQMAAKLVGDEAGPEQSGPLGELIDDFADLMDAGADA